MAESKSAKPEKSAPAAPAAKSAKTGGSPAGGPGRGRKLVKSALGALPLLLMAWLLSAMAAAIGAPKWLAIAVAVIVLAGPPGWHLWAERRRKKAGKPQGKLTRHDRWLLRAGASLGLPLIVILVFFRGTAWDAVKTEGLWFAKSPPKTHSEIAVERLRYIPADARVLVDLSGVDAQAKTFLTLLFQGKVPVYGNKLPLAFASGDSDKQTVFLYRAQDVTKGLSAWTKQERRGRTAWVEPEENEGDSHVAFRVGDLMVVAKPEWVDTVVDTIEDETKSAAAGKLSRAVQLRGDEQTVLSFLARDVNLTPELSLDVGYLAWTKTKTGLALRGAAGGNKTQRDALKKALEDTFEARQSKFPVLKKLKLKISSDGDVLKFRLEIPADVAQAILLQPAIFSFS